MMRAPGAATTAVTRVRDRAGAPVPTTAPRAAAVDAALPRTDAVEATGPAAIGRTGNSVRGVATNAPRAPVEARPPTGEGATNARNGPPEGRPDRAPGPIGPPGARTTGGRAVGPALSARKATVPIGGPHAPAVLVRNVQRAKAAPTGGAKAAANGPAAMTGRTAHHAPHGGQRRAAIGTATTAVPRHAGPGPPPAVAGAADGATARWTAGRR